MTPRLLCWGAVWLLLSCPLLSAQDTSPGPGIAPVPELFQPADFHLLSAQDSTGTEPEDLPPPLTTAPPPEPQAPAWGHYEIPSSGVVPVIPRDYQLVGPPPGLSPDPDEQLFQATLTDPESVLALDAGLSQTVSIDRPDGIGPIGLFGDHTLPAGRAFVSYRYLQDVFHQNMQGSSHIPTSTGYPFAPTRMLQNTQVALVEYGITQDLTILGYLPFQHNEIESLSAAGNYKASFTNPGDLRVMALIVLGRGVGTQQHLNLGLNLPTGLLEQATAIGVVPTPSLVVPDLPYQIRASSGTFDLLLGYTYRRQTERWTWGTQVNAVIRTGKNSLGYELGNQFEATTWLSRKWSDRWSTSARLDGHVVGNIRGADNRLDTTLSPANQTGTQGYQNLNGLLGVNYLWPRPGRRIQEQRLFLEAGLPLYQWVDGPQLGLSWVLNAGWGMAF